MLRAVTGTRGLLAAPARSVASISRQSHAVLRFPRQTLVRSFAAKAAASAASISSTDRPPEDAAAQEKKGKTVHRGHSRKRAVAEPDVQGPEPVYNKIVYGYETFHLTEPFHTELGGTLPELNIAYETWGKLNADKSNAILLHTGLSASSHAHSHPRNPDPGWWEKFIGPGLALDTNKFFVICSNNLGGCYGTTGPSSPRHPLFKPYTDKHLKPITLAPPDPVAAAQAVKQKVGRAQSAESKSAGAAGSSSNPPRYALDFPLVTVNDMVSAQFKLVDHLGIKKLYASIGSSLGGMQSLAAAANFPDRVQRCVSISAAGRCTPMAIALRYAQRRVLMSDPNWKDGNYYAHNTFPLMGMKHAREVATISYRSGPEWEERFGRKRVDQHAHPSLQADFMIERYLERQASEFCLKYDPNSLLYISKAMDLFDLGHKQASFAKGVARVKCPTLIIGVQSDILFPIYQQRELAHALLEAGTPVTFYELNALYGHDTFLIDVAGITSAVKGHLERTDSQSTIDDTPIDTDNY